MKTFITTMFVILFFAGTSFAEEISFSWGFDNSEIDKFILYIVTDTGSEVVPVDIPSDARTVTIDAEHVGDCNTYYLTAAKGDLESGPSETAAWCIENAIPPAIHLPNKPFSFIITVTPTQ